MTAVTEKELREHQAEISWDREDWQRLVAASLLPAIRRLIALTVAVYAGADGRQGAWLSYADVARMSGLLSAPAARYHLDRLKEQGWLCRDGENGPWFLAWPEGGRR